MVLGCTLAGLADHALYMHRLAPSEGDVLDVAGQLLHGHQILNSDPEPVLAPVRHGFPRQREFDWTIGSASILINLSEELIHVSKAGT